MTIKGDDLIAMDLACMGMLNPCPCMLTTTCMGMLTTTCTHTHTHTQGVKAVIAESFERIHRSNLVGMGIVPLQFLEGQTAATLGLTGAESYSIELPEKLTPGQLLTVKVSSGREGGGRRERERERN